MLIRYSVCSYLESRGYKVETATNGEEAMAVISRAKVNLIVTDMRMPKMSGTEFITALKSKPETSRVPVVVVTGKANGSSEADARADFVIYKDIDVQTQLDAALESITEDQSRGNAAGK
jgi:CheY-like chemotaxis protein